MIILGTYLIVDYRIRDWDRKYVIWPQTDHTETLNIKKSHYRAMSSED
jgi:hypothetical protein